MNLPPRDTPPDVIDTRPGAAQQTPVDFRATFEQAPVGIVHTDLSGRLLRVNDQFCEMLGYGRDELTGRQFSDITYPDSIDLSLAMLSRLVSGEIAYCRFEKRYRRKDGSDLWAEMNISAARQAGGAIDYLITIAQDIGPRKAMEANLRESEARFRSLTSLSSDWYWELDAEGRVIEASGRVLSEMGIPPDSLRSRDYRQLQEIELLPKGRSPFDIAFAAKQGFQGVICQARLADGQIHHLEISAEPKFNASGDFEGFRGTGRDVTRRHEAAGELEATLRFSRNTLDALTLHICVIDEHGAIVAVNRAWREFARANYGVPQLVLEGNNYLAVCSAVTGPDVTDAVTFARGARAVLSGDRDTFVMEYACHSPDEQRWFQTRITRFDDYGPPRAVVAHENITERKRQEEDHRRFRYAMDSTVDGIFLIDPVAMRYLDVNATACQMFGYSREEMLALRPGYTAGLSLDETTRQYRELITGGVTVQTIEQMHRHKNGTHVAVETVRRLVRTGDDWVAVTSVRDITQRKQAEAAARRHAARQGLIATFSQKALATTDLDQLLQDAVMHLRDGLEADFSRLLRLQPDGRSFELAAGSGWAPAGNGWRPAEPEGRFLHTYLMQTGEPVIVEDFSVEARFSAEELLSAHQVASAAEVLIAGKSGRFGTLGAFSRTAHRFGIEDISFLQSIANIVETAVERRRSEERLAYLSQFDELTGLPNRSLLHDRLGQTLTQAERNRWQVGLLIVDLDRFKGINDTLGHAAGDEVLRHMAARLQGCVRSGDTVARLSADEFAVVLMNLAQPDDAGRVAQKIMQVCGQPFEIEGGQTQVTVSIGVALYPGDSNTADDMLRRANIAVHRAKDMGRDNCQFYLPEMNRNALARMRIENELRGALERGEFLLHYQPKADLYTGAICGFEALLRWQHPQRGLVPPLQFIGVLEETGLIVQVGNWAIRSVCREILAWQAQGLTALPVAVNLSVRQFAQKNLDVMVGEILRENGVDPHLLELELTESLLMTDPEEAAQTLRNLKTFGVRLAVDDFGTGYSSLAYLKRFPIDALKIDRAFIRDCITDPGDAMIAIAVINLAHSLNLKVVAEGVETEAQLNFLRSHGCDQIQGYYFAKPLDIAHATKAIAEGARLQRTVTEDDSNVTTLLLVDDNSDDLELHRIHLEPDGYRFLTAQGPQIALDLLARQRVHAVISDQRMPGMSGAEFLAAVRKLYPEVTRIMLTGSEDPALLPKAVNEAGIHKFLSKDWSAEQLRLALREVFPPRPGAGQ